MERRGTYELSEKSSSVIEEARGKMTSLIGGDNKDHLIFTPNATFSLNMTIKGILKQGDHALICSYSHNSVIRPMEKLKREGVIEYDRFEIDQNGDIDIVKFQKQLKPNTRIVVLNHASNVIGIVASFENIAKECRSKGICFILDCTQSLGYAPLNLQEMPIDILCGTGHKTLLGPTGIGFAYFKKPQEIDNMIVGGSGGNHSFSSFHPQQMPYKFEAGTVNTTGIAGLNGSLNYIQSKTFKKIAKVSMELTEYAWKELSQIDEIYLYGSDNMKKKVPIISFNLSGIIPNEAGYIYNSKQMCLRVGLHCAPYIHKTLNTLPTGTIRVSFGHMNTIDQVKQFINVTKTIIMETKYGKTCA